jgi:hypothetical protein
VTVNGAATAAPGVPKAREMLQSLWPGSQRYSFPTPSRDGRRDGDDDGKTDAASAADCDDGKGVIASAKADRDPDDVDVDPPDESDVCARIGPVPGRTTEPEPVRV